MRKLQMNKGTNNNEINNAREFLDAKEKDIAELNASVPKRKFKLPENNYSNASYEEVNTPQGYYDPSMESEMESQSYVPEESKELPFKEELNVDVQIEQRVLSFSSYSWYKDNQNKYSDEIVSQWFIDGCINELGFIFEYGYTQSFNVETKTMERMGNDRYSVKIGNGFTEALFDFKVGKNNFMPLNIEIAKYENKFVPMYGSKRQSGDKWKFFVDYNNIFSTDLLQAVMLIAEKIHEDLFK